jgi:hypothetical protein
MEKIFQINRVWKHTVVSVCVSDQVEFKTKLFRRDKEDLYLSEREKIHQDNIMVVSIYALNVCVPNYIRQHGWNKMTEARIQE